MKDEKFPDKVENQQPENITSEETKQAPRFNVNIPTETAEATAQLEEVPVAETKAVPKKAPVKPQGDPVRKVTAEKTVRKAPAVSPKQLQKEKKARNCVVALSCLMAIITVVTAVIGSVTDIFKAEDVKAVAVLILPQEDKEELERHLTKLWPLADTGFDTETMSGTELFGYIRPYSDNGLYSSFGYTSTAVTDEADPAERFKDENGNYSYYKIPCSDIDRILSHFGLEENHTINSSEAYYYDSYYYFMGAGVSDQKTDGKVTILDSKRIQDGRYYVTAEFGKKEVYVTASMIAGQQGNEWNIHSMSLTPVFDSLGLMIKTEKDAASNYEIRQSVIEGKAKDGTVFRKYIVKYPYFFGDAQGEIQANSFYSSVITYYQQQSQQIQSEYNKFKKKGGKTDSLPLEIHYTAQVSFSDESNLCLINEIAESVAMYSADDEAEVKLPVRTIECNTFDMETGVYISKDNIIGKDYITAEKLLYRLYYGYDYEALLDPAATDISVPDDTYKLGAKIYNSASTLCEDGYVFCYVDSDGLREDVVISFEAVELLKASQQ